MMDRYAAETCHTCTASYRCDRAHGLIYGAYKAGNTFVDSHVFAAITGLCTYCNSRLPSRRLAILRRLVPTHLHHLIPNRWTRSPQE